MNIGPNGVSIFDLENINRKYGIHLESYRITAQELRKSNISDFFIVLLFRNNLEHFAIAKKFKRHCILYDSDLGKIRITYPQLIKVFAEKILLIEKVEKSKIYKSKLKKQKNNIPLLKISKLLASIGIELTCFSLLLLCFSANKLIFEDIKELIKSENIEDQDKILPDFPRSIKIQNLNYHNGSKDIFKNLNLTILPNTLIIGKSGSGKSTLFKLISKKLPNANKTIFFNNISISQISDKFFNNLVIYQISSSDPIDIE
ncbi:hypothetical protein PVNG_02388 [Plasmodium vivax North Korean]|uniref:ABC transporter domain-containing protein n=1 Tax=Plasmodium vivax North Korean TaxID=1035514 RepID=A0A0J9TKJ6_PLAVI|nr:hypothetical protein PVNG_02388 [Plasmodium vivax North Korean]